jgi:outer membrane protein assembly factor BamB
MTEFINQSNKIVAILVVTALVSPSFFMTTGAEIDAPWPMHGHDAQHSGQSPYNISGNAGKLTWVFDPLSNHLYPPAIGSDGTIYTGCDTYRSKICTGLLAIGKDGKKKWAFKTDGEVHTTPAIGNDGTIYFGSYDGKFYAIHPDGTLKWYYKTGGKITSSPMLDDNGTIYFGGQDGKFYAINPEGAVKWTFSNISDSYSEVVAAPVIDTEGIIYFISRGGYLYSLDREGGLRWKTRWSYAELVLWDEENAPMIGPDGTVYVGVMVNYLPKTGYFLYAVDSSGNVDWKFDCGMHAPGTMAVGTDGSIIVSLMYDSTDMRNFTVSIGPDGKEKWRFEAPCEPSRSHIAVDVNGLIVVGSRRVKPNQTTDVYVLDPNGKIVWKYSDDTVSSLSHPVISPEGRIYVVGDGGIYAIGEGGWKPKKKDNDENINERIQISSGLMLLLLAIVLIIYVRTKRKN